MEQLIREKLIVAYVAKKFINFNEVYYNVYKHSLQVPIPSQMNPIHKQNFSKYSLILLFLLCLFLPSNIFPPQAVKQKLCSYLSSPLECYMSRPSHNPPLERPFVFGKEQKLQDSSLLIFFQISVPSDQNVFSTRAICIFTLTWQTRFHTYMKPSQKTRWV